jgi:hypothetical protein
MQERSETPDVVLETYRRAVSDFYSLRERGIRLDYWGQKGAEQGTMRLITLLEEAGQDEEAAELFAKFQPISDRGFLHRGRYYKKNGQVNEALDDFIELAAGFPKNTSGPRELLALCEQYDLFDEALAAIEEQIAETGPETPLAAIRKQLLDGQSEMKE